MIVSVRDIQSIASFAEAKSCQLARSDKFRSLEIDQRVFDPTEVGDFKELKLCTARRIVPQQSSNISDGKQYCPQIM